MSLTPPLSAAPIIQAHAYPAILAIALGATQFALRKGVALRRAPGWTFAAAMMALAVAGFFTLHHGRIMRRAFSGG